MYEIWRSKKYYNVDYSHDFFAVVLKYKSRFFCRYEYVGYNYLPKDKSKPNIRNFWNVFKEKDVEEKVAFMSTWASIPEKALNFMLRYGANIKDATDIIESRYKKW